MNPSLFKVLSLREDVFLDIKKLVSDFKDFKPSQTKRGYNKSIRNSSVCYIDGSVLNHLIFPIIQKVNNEEKWNFKLVEPDGYTFNKYEVDNFYIWHTDGKLNDKETYVRKISFSLSLSNDYTGGDFLIQSERTTDFSKMTYERFHLKENQMIIFKSDVNHCVEPVTSGIRDSLVGWIYGPRSWNL